MSEIDSTQLSAVESGKKAVIVTGPPGSGKTRIIEWRFEHLLNKRGVPLSSILAFSFSAATVARLRRRIERIIGGSYCELWIHTYHSLAGFILTEHAMISRGAGLRALSAPAFITPFKEYLIVKELLRSKKRLLESDLKRVASKGGFAREVVDFFDLLAQNLITSDDFAKTAQNLTPRLNDLARLYSTYSDYISEKNWVGPGASVGRAVKILEDHPDFLEECRSRFRHILVDEFQEVDPAQLRLLELLTARETSLFVVGDEDQRIYRFRGSMTGQFERIRGLRPEAETIRLDAGYRLPPEIVTASGNLIRHNREDAGEPRRLDASEAVEVSPAYSDAIEQAYDVARDIKRHVLDGDEAQCAYSDFAVLCRSTTRSATALEEAFSYYEVPYVLYNSTSFYKNPMTRRVAAFIRLLVDTGDDSSLLRVLSAPSLGIDAVELRRIINDLSRTRGRSLYETLRTASSGIEDRRTAGLLRKFFDRFEDMRKRALGGDCPSALVHAVMQDFFFGEILDNDDALKGTRDAGNLRLLSEVVSDIEGVLAGMRGRCSLADVAEHMEHAFAHFSSQQENDPADESAEGVAIMTVHQAKGMGFPFVYLVDMTDEFFPRLGGRTTLLDGRSTSRLTNVMKSGGTSGTGSGAPRIMFGIDEQLREERRLAYVAMTRASRRLVVCHTSESNFSEPVRPSPFIDEFLGKEYRDDDRQEQIPVSPPANVRSRLRLALNEQEIESALREFSSRVVSNDEAKTRLSALFESLGLDAEFICEESPFEADPERALDLSGRVYSASQLKTYLECPRKFFFEKLLRMAPERPEDFGLGQLVHRTLELFHEKITDFTGEADELESELKRIFQAIWNGAGRGEAFREKYATALQQTTVERRALEIFGRYIFTETRDASDRKIIARESSITFEVAGHEFIARIDRIDSTQEGHRIIDYKTAASGTPMRPATIKKKFINLDDKPDYKPADFQLPLYLLAARSAGYEPCELVYYWLAQEDSRKDSNGTFRRSGLRIGEGDPDVLTSEEMAAAERNIMDVVGQISRGSFAPDPLSSFGCARCAFNAICSVDGKNDNDE